MKIPALFAFALASLALGEIQRVERGTLVMEDIPEIPARIAERILQYQNTRAAALEDWYPDGQSLLMATRFGETQQLHQITQPAGMRRQITFFPEPVNSASVCPDASNPLILFNKDIGGNEFYQVFGLNYKEGTVKLMTDGKSRHGAVVWSRKGDRFAYYGTARNKKDWDIYIQDTKGGDGQIAWREGGFWTPLEWSPDDSKLLISKSVSANESYLYMLDIAAAKVEQINPKSAGSEPIAYGAATWAADGHGIYLASDEGSEFQRLKLYDIATKQQKEVTADIPWDIEKLDRNPMGDTLAFTANEDGMSALYLMKTASQEKRKVGGIPPGQITGLKFHPDGKRLALEINNSQTPSDIFLLDTTEDKLTRWTYSEIGGLDSEKFVSPSLIRFDTFDQVDGMPRKIPAFYYKPTRAQGRLPVVIQIHGGPEAQYVPIFSASIQYMINELGIAVIAPNVRGSAGYGKSYLKLDNGFLREDSVKDIGALLDWVGKQPELDPQRVCVMGGSYGGYMTLASMMHYNERLACGIDIVGISNFVTFLNNTEAYRRDLRRVEYGDERDPKMKEYLTRVSPANQAKKITKPMMIAQGRNDPRVPVTESEQMVKAIRENGGKVWYFLATDEGHGFQKKGNRDAFTNATMAFLEKFLVGS